MGIFYRSKCLDYTVYGKSEQDGTPTPENPVEIKCVDGVRNLFSGSVASINSRVSTGTGGTYSSAGWSVCSYIEIKPSTDYVLLFPTDYTSYECFYDENHQLISGGEWKSNTTRKTPANAKYVKFDFKSEDINAVMLEEGTVAHKYVPYGTWLRVDNVGKNLFDKNNANILNAYFTSTTRIITNSVDTRTTYISISGGKLYTISKKAGQRFMIGTTTEVPKNGSTVSNIVREPTASSITIQTTNDAKYLVVYYYDVKADTLTEQELLDSIQIEQGTEATPYESYIEPKTYFLPLDKKNLFNKDDITPNKWINTANGAIQSNNAWNQSKEIKIKASTNYKYFNDTTMDRNGVFELSQYDVNKNWLRTSQIGNTGDKGGNFTTLENANYIIFGYRNDLGLENIRLYEGPSSEDHYELCSTKDLSVRDEYIVENGYADISKKMGKYIFTGDEDWVKGGTNKSGYSRFGCSSLKSTIKIPSDDNEVPKIMSNITVANSANNTYRCNNGISVTNIGSIHIYDDKFKEYTVEEFKQWLKDNLAYIEYELAEPYTADMGQVDFPLIDGEITGIAYGGKMIYDTNKGKE